MFAGLDDLDWPAMRHAYGSAAAVPGLLRGLVDPDPAVRETALDSIYGAVHHQGDVYDSTAAAVPFLLEALRTPGLPGRDGIAELLAGIAESGRWNRDVDEADRRAEPEAALQAIEAAAPGLGALAADADPTVRGAVAPLLAITPDGIALLVRRLVVETDTEARQGVLDGLGATADPAVAEHLLALAEHAPVASTAIAALTAAARIAPERIPTDHAAELLKRAYAEPAEPAEPAGFETDTLIGALRVRRERSDRRRRNPHAARLADTFARLLGPRVAERTAILAGLLREPHADVAQDALYGCMHLIERWRGDYRELISLVAGHLTHPDAELARTAEEGLQHWVPLSAPAADALAAHVVRGAGLVRHRSGPPSLTPALDALIELGDERAFGYLVAIVRGPEQPRSVIQRLRAFPQHAERIVELLLASAAAPDDMVVALSACGAAARPAVSRILSAPLKGWTVRALARIGGDEAMDAVRAAMRSTDVPAAIAAAGALGRLEATPNVLDVLGSHLEAPSALEEVAAIGPAARDLLPRIRPMLATSDRWHWTPVNAAIAVWRVAGDAEAATPALVAAWHGNERTRTRIAEQAADIPALTPLFEAELAEPERAGTDDDSFSSNQVAEDERLLAACRAALGIQDAFHGGPGAPGQP